MYICFKIVAGTGVTGPRYWKRADMCSMLLTRMDGKAQEQMSFSDICLLWESSPDLPKAAALSKAEDSISCGLAGISCHHVC